MARDGHVIRYAIYTRQSVEKLKDFSSCEAQFNTCQEFVNAMGAPTLTWCGQRFDDEGHSGAILDRPAFNRLRQLVANGGVNDDDLLTGAAVRKMLDPACGTGGMLAEAQRYLRDHNLDAKLYTYGQDYNKRAFATAASDMLIKEVAHNGAGENIKYGDAFLDDQFAGQTFDYLIANPPFGVDWKKQQKEIKREHEKRGFDGRFGAGLPRVNDGSLLFLQHMIDKFEPFKPDQHKHGSRLAIVFSGSPLFTGGAGSGESNIRKWIIENDWLEAIVALPEQMFYNTGIGTYIWIVTNRKDKKRKGKIQLYDARDIYISMRRSMGDKRRKIGEGPDAPDGREPDQIADIVKGYGRFAASDRSKIFNNADFGYTRVTVERPLRLRYRMTAEGKARFLDALPHLLDDVQAIDKQLGRECLNAFYCFSLRQVDHVVQTYVKYHNTMRPHQALGNVPLNERDGPEEREAVAGSIGSVRRTRLLGGLLNHYGRKAA